MTSKHAPLRPTQLGLLSSGVLQRKQASQRELSEVPMSVDEVLHSSGQPLDRETRAFMEPRLGHDFSKVRVHTSEKAGASAKAVNALAYTVGQNIVFAPSHYQPKTLPGKQLLAHELSHVVQQSSQLLTGPLELDNNPVAETQADQAASSVSQGHSATVNQAPARGLQRQAGPVPAPADGGLSAEMLAQIVRHLREAMAGWGTDEEAIYAALSGRTQEQVDAIARVYQTTYKRTLLRDLQDELNESEMQHLAQLSPLTATPGSAGAKATEGETLASAVAQQLKEAMAGWGTDEDAIYAALSGRTASERTAIKTAYKALTGNDLETDLRDELSDSELRHALVLLNQGVLQAEDELYLAVAGLGTDEATIVRVLKGLAGNQVEIEAMESRYRSKYGDLIADLRSDLSGDDYKQAIAILGPVLQDVAFEDCPAHSIPDVRKVYAKAVAQTSHTIAVLGKGWKGMNAAEKAVFNRFFDPAGTGDIDEAFVQQVKGNYQRILGDLSHDYVIECESSCDGLQGYYFGIFGLGNIHVCPLFLKDTEREKVATIIHETGHRALEALDRPYFHEKDYAKMTPRGSALTQIPVFGYAIRAIACSDTLYALDAYAYCAYDMP